MYIIINVGSAMAGLLYRAGGQTTLNSREIFPSFSHNDILGAILVSTSKVWISVLDTALLSGFLGVCRRFWVFFFRLGTTFS